MGTSIRACLILACTTLLWSSQSSAVPFTFDLSSSTLMGSGSITLPDVDRASTQRRVRLVKGSHIVLKKFWQGEHAYQTERAGGGGATTEWDLG